MLRLLIIYFSPKNVATFIFPESQNETLPKIPQNVQWITGGVRGFAGGPMEISPVPNFGFFQRLNFNPNLKNHQQMHSN
jgi:hypothetical protein